MPVPTLTGPERPLSSHVEPAEDEVIAVFRNGAVEDIYAPGRRLRAIWRKYKPGSLTYARILRTDIQFGRTLVSVAVKDDWTLPEVQVTAFVAMNPSNNYGMLRERLQARGLNFMAALTVELDMEMERFARKLISPLTHDEVVGQQVPDHWGATESLMHGFFLVDILAITAVAGDPYREAIKDAERGMKVDEVQNRRATRMADARGMSLDQYENKDRHAQQHALAMQNNQTQIELARIQVELARVEREAETRIKVTSIENIRALTTARRSGMGLDVTSLKPGDAALTGSAGVVDAEIVEPDTINVNPTRTPAMIRAWTRAGGAREHVLGAVAVDEDGERLAVLVLDQMCRRLKLHNIIDQTAGGADCVVLYSDTLLTWVEKIIEKRVPGFRESGATVGIAHENDTLLIQVGSPHPEVRAGKLVKDISAPGTLVLPALSELVAFDVICVPAPD